MQDGVGGLGAYGYVVTVEYRATPSTSSPIIPVGVAVPATVETSYLSRTEKSVIEHDGGWSVIRRPGLDTAASGLALLFGDATWTPGVGKGRYGTDFGPLVDKSVMADFSTHPAWVPASKRILARATSALVNGVFLLDGYKTAEGYFDMQSAAAYDAYLRNCSIHGSPAILNAISQQANPLGTITVENCKLDFVSIRCVQSATRMAVRRCLLDRPGADCIGPSGDTTGPLPYMILEQCLLRRAAHTSIGDPAAHGDLFQAVNLKNASICANTFYYPGTGTTYDESVYGSTNCIRNADNTSLSTDVYVLGNLLIGGARSVQLWPRYVGSELRNHLFAFNRYGPAPYYLYGQFLLDHGSSTSWGTWANVGMFEEYDTAGNVVSPAGNSLPASYAARAPQDRMGIFSFDRSKMSAKYIQAIRRIEKATGRTILQWNNDLNRQPDTVRGLTYNYDLGALL